MTKNKILSGGWKHLAGEGRWGGGEGNGGGKWERGEWVLDTPMSTPSQTSLGHSLFKKNSAKRFFFYFISIFLYFYQNLKISTPIGQKDR